MSYASGAGFRRGPKFMPAGLLLVFMAGMAGPAASQTSGTWTATGSLNTPRNSHTATLLANGQVLVAGGKSTAGTILSSAELYNPVSGTWTITGSMSAARMTHTATLLPNGEVLVAGGSGTAGSLTSAELYNPSTGLWSSTGSMALARSGQGATLLQNGLVLVAGGNNSGTSSDTITELYNPSNGAWKTTGNLSSAVLSAPLILLLDGRALLAPGQIYSPSTGQWSSTASVYYPSHVGLTAALMANGVLIYGDLFACYAAEFYNPSANTWTPTKGQCGNGLTTGQLVLLTNGKVLLSGGFDRYSGHAYAETYSDLYNPSTNTWSPTGRLEVAGAHTLTLLANGQVLAIGGVDAELYTP
jgi:N-acetylneuraminic acid mutarotase